MQSEAQKRANANYRKRNVKNVSVPFYPGDMDVLEWLDIKGGRASYIKGLLREQMKKEQEVNG